MARDLLTFGSIVTSPIAPDSRTNSAPRPRALAVRGRQDLGQLTVERLTHERATLSGSLVAPVAPGEALSVFFRFAGRLPHRATGILQRCSSVGHGDRLELRLTSIDAGMSAVLEERRLTDLEARFRDASRALAAR